MPKICQFLSFSLSVPFALQGAMLGLPSTANLVAPPAAGTLFANCL